MSAVDLSRRRTRRMIIAATAALATAAGLAITYAGSNSQQELLTRAARSFLADTQGGEVGAGAETEEVGSAISAFNDPRQAPGFAKPGGYDAAVAAMSGMSDSGGAWHEVTNLPYNADDTRYRDYASNSSSGVGYVTGRVQALAADGKYLYAAGAVGGVARQNLSDPSGSWTNISAGVPALAGGALAVAPDGSLWFATGDGSTGSTTYVGDGVWVAPDPQADTPTWTQVGGAGNILNGAVVQHIYFSNDGGTAYVPTSYGVYSHSTTSLAGAWEPVFVPNPDALPSSSTTYPTDGSGFADNWVSDIALDPQNPNHMIAALGWVAGGAQNGWYDGHFTKQHGWIFTKVNPKGAVIGSNIGRTTFAFSSDSKKLYALVQDPAHASQGISYSELQGVYVSNNGSILGPWSKIADSQKLANSGSALKPTVPGSGLVFPGYQPGVQAWYNQFLAVDPTNDNHVFVGLEEVFQSTDAGAQWQAIGPYWNFFFPCWSQGYSSADSNYQFGQNCPLTTHPDQHSIVIAQYGGSYHAIVGNDGGIYDWPLGGTIDALKHGTSWIDRTAQQTPDFLQYYSVSVGMQTADGLAGTATLANLTDQGKAVDTNGVIVSGGMQDNGGSILISPQDTVMGSNFGGDGGDSLVDPDNGCNIVQEYVDLSMSLTTDCASPTNRLALVEPSQANTISIAPPDTAAQFIAPFAADHTTFNHWIAAGQHVWYNPAGFGISGPGGWTSMFDLGAGNTATAVASSGDQAIVGYCGSCKPGNYAGGYAFGALGNPDSWQQIDLATVGLPNRWIGGADVYQDTSDTTHYLLAFNGFSRRWTEGPGAGVGHVFTSTNGTNWTDLSGNLPDVPLSTVKWLGANTIVVGSDLGAFITFDADTTDLGGPTWYILGTGLPMSVVTDLEPGPDGSLYAATYGRGIWKLDGASIGGIPRYAGSDSSYQPGQAQPSAMTTVSGSGGSGHGPATKPSSPATPPANGSNGNNGKKH